MAAQVCAQGLTTALCSKQVPARLAWQAQTLAGLPGPSRRHSLRRRRGPSQSRWPACPAAVPAAGSRRPTGPHWFQEPTGRPKRSSRPAGAGLLLHRSGPGSSALTKAAKPNMGTVQPRCQSPATVPGSRTAPRRTQRWRAWPCRPSPGVRPWDRMTSGLTGLSRDSMRRGSSTGHLHQDYRHTAVAKQTMCLKPLWSRLPGISS